MKLSIALSSILAVCSVTTATPVLSTATTSVESTSTTVSPNAIATSGPDYLKYPSPYDEYTSHCHPISLEMLMLLEEFVLIGLGCDALSDEIDERRVKIYAEVDIMDELQERFDTVMGDSSNYGLGNLDLEAAIRTQHELLEKLHKESMGLLGKHWNGVQERDATSFYAVTYHSHSHSHNLGMVQLFKILVVNNKLFNQARHIVGFE
ncbi:hypothetical protein BDEG_23860 [Batrachochytrium dendrobatidis JEL423]|uniref:Uncharacterized protein n=1 Tax=Batrachochytrium dendrobatidis (strain JEL423) TaxID=403673 RepID=A0A177WJ24_BATDL|nr:hypothetical protein BDEG_23860 [Batrachochytrium dendrobatidis JEL423]